MQALALNRCLFRGLDGQRGAANNATIIAQFGRDYLKVLMVNCGRPLAYRPPNRLEEERAGSCN